MRQFSGTCAFHIGRRRFLGPVRKFRTVPSFNAQHIAGKGENLPRKSWLFGGSFVVAIALVSVIAVVAIGASGGTPANKVTAAGDKAVVMTPQGPGVTLLTATMATSKPTDLILSVTLECSILTTVTNSGMTSTANAQGQVRVWVEVDDQIVPVQSISSPPQNTPPAGDDSDKAVFCERVHQVDFTNNANDTLTQYQKTKNANAFNWLRQNVGAGNHTITVKADLSSSAMNGTASAVVGNRTLVIDPTKMANDAIIGNPGTSG